VSPAPPEREGPEPEREPATLEQVLDQLEGAVRRLADQSAPLERMVADWERAQALAVDAERRLEAIESSLRSQTEEKSDSGDRPGRDGPAA